MITFNNINKEYSEGEHALHDISIHIGKGEFVFVTGESGAGKSTFIKLLTKEINPTSGNMTVCGIDTAKLKKRQIPKYRRHIGCIFQDFRLLYDRNVYDNVAFAERIANTPTRKIERKVPQLLAMVGLSSKADAMPDKLSGGERQRVAIARALANSPEILLADEPTGNLDEFNSWEIMRLLSDINEQGVTVVVVTHDMDIVNQMHRRVIPLKRGMLGLDSAYADVDILTGGASL